MDEVWGEKIKAYRESLKGPKPDLDMSLLFRILDVVNESSEVHVAINPVDDEAGWSSDAPTYAVAGVCRLDDGRIALRVNSEKHGMEAGDLYVKLKHELKHVQVDKMPVLYVRGEKVVQLTDAYSHSLVREMWAGMPFDLVLAVDEDA